MLHTESWWHKFSHFHVTAESTEYWMSVCGPRFNISMATITFGPHVKGQIPIVVTGSADVVVKFGHAHLDHVKNSGYSWHALMRFIADNTGPGHMRPVIDGEGAVHRTALLPGVANAD